VTTGTLLSRLEWFETVTSTNDIVAGWLREGTPEICVAVADEQTAGRGRNGRTWSAPAGAALLCSVGFRPTWLEPDRAWRLAAIVSLAMADAAESTAGLEQGTIRLKWPNDLVIETDAVRKVAGVLGETDGLATPQARAVIGIGINADWRRADFPPEIADSMTSLREAARGRQVDRKALLDRFVSNLAGATDALSGGEFDADAWTERQLTNGRPVRLELPNGTSEIVQALGVDPETGALLIANPREGTRRSVLVGEIRHLRV
jgi:BirA family biotin operon repressor/biotin-[acetyl-CoA-carboxylase] ligase